MNIPIINKRVKMLINHFSSGSENDFAKKIGVSQGTINRLFREDIRYNHIPKVTNNTISKILQSLSEVNPSWLREGKGEMIVNEYPTIKTVSEPTTEYSNGNPQQAKKIPINYMKVPIIPIKAQAGYLSNYGDDAYMNELDTVLWEIDDREYKGHYVVFEVSGDSMDDNSADAILEGDKILCREIAQKYWIQKLHINKWDFVIVHKDEGIIVKRIIEHNVEQGTIQCHSLNDYYEDFELHLKDVIALYNVVDLKRNRRR